MILLKSLLSRKAYGGDSGSTPILMVLPASDGYFCATLDGSHDCADAPCARRRPVMPHSSSLIVFDMNMANPIQVERYNSGSGGISKRNIRCLTAAQGQPD